LRVFLFYFSFTDIVIVVVIIILLQEPNENVSLYRNTQEHGYLLQEPSSLYLLTAARPFPPAASAGPMGCGRTIGQGCVQSIVDGMNCDHGTYVDMCNMCQCAKVKSVGVVCVCCVG